MPITNDNFKEDILELIQDGTSSQFTFQQNDIGDGTGNHYIRMSVFEEDGTFIKHYYSNKTWNNDEVYYVDDVPYYRNDPYSGYSVDSLIEEGDNYRNWLDIVQLPVYKDSSGNIFIKPNDVFEKDADVNYLSGKYQLRFDFVDSVFNHVSNDPDGDYDRLDKPKFWVKQVSTSRKELRLLASHLFQGDDNSNLEFNTGFQDSWKDWISPGGIYSADFHLMSLSEDNAPDNLTIINSQFDPVSLSSTSLILKFEEPLSNDINNLHKVDVIREIYPTQTQEIIFFSEDYKKDDIQFLTPSTDHEVLTINSDKLFANGVVPNVVN